MTIYVVTSGEYSDYRIEAMFTTRERAQAYIDAVCLSDANDIEEWELDPLSQELQDGLLPFCVNMAKDGTVSSVGRATYDVNKSCKLACHFPRHERSVVELKCTCWAKDEQHAIKIANEKRAQIIAMNLWRKVSEMPKRDWCVEVEI